MDDFGDFAKQLEDEIMNSTSNCEEEKVGTCFVERTEEIHWNSDNKVNIMECSGSRGRGLLEAEYYSDTTECSSSFDDSDCGGEGIDDSEVLSGFYGGNESALDLYGSGKTNEMRKKLSSHWRAYIQPLMWRCNWLELKWKELEAQARKYEMKLQECGEKNLVQLEKSTLEGQTNARRDVLRRKKRRRAEETEDVAAYMSNHNLFSYYEHKERIDGLSSFVLNNPADAQKKVNNDVELGNEELLCAEAGNSDKFLEDVLRKIELLHSRVLKLKTRTDKIMTEHATKISSADTVSPPPTPVYRMPMETYMASHLMSEYNLGGLLLPESAVPSNGEVVTDANGSRNHDSLLVFAYENEDEYDDDEDILIDNQRVREELHYYEELEINSFKNRRMLKNALGTTSIPQAPKSTNDQRRLRDRSSYSNLTNIPESSSKRWKKR